MRELRFEVRSSGAVASLSDDEEMLSNLLNKRKKCHTSPEVWHPY
jgi:hypothetical protein